MTPFGNWLRRQWERWVGKWYEGPTPPQRLREMVVLFANMYPHATRQEWVEFAAGHAGEAYTSGYVRGWERSERDPEAMPWRVTNPEMIADEMDPGWRDGPSVLQGNAEMIVGDKAPSSEELANAQYEILSRQPRHHG